MQQSTSKRKRDENLGLGDSTFNNSSEQNLSLSALGGGGGGGLSVISGSSSFLASSSISATGGSSKTCNIPSHSRLESIVKQTELLRRMDADAHSVLRAEATEIREKLEIQVSALEAQIIAMKTRGSAIVSSSTTTQGPIASVVTNDDDEIDLTADTEPEDDIISGTNKGHGGSNDATLRVELARSREEIVELKRMMAQERRNFADEKKSHERALASADAALLKASSSVSSSSSSFIPRDLVSALPIQLNSATSLVQSQSEIFQHNSELAEIRESLRASQRRERAMAEEIKRLQQQHTSSTILTEKLSESQRKLVLSEKEAANTITLRSSLTSAMGALAQWDSAVWESIAQREVRSPPPSGGNDISLLISNSNSHSQQVREAIIELQRAHRMLFATVSEQKLRLEAASKGREALSERQATLLLENSKLMASVATAKSEGDAAKRETSIMSTHCEQLKALVKHYEADNKVGTCTRQAVQSIDEQAKALAKALTDLPESMSQQGTRGGGRQQQNNQIAVHIASLQKSLQQTAESCATSIRASEEATAAIKSRCNVLEKTSSDLKAQLVASIDAVTKLNLVPSVVAESYLSGQRLAEEECAQLEKEVRALYALDTPRVGGVNSAIPQETFSDGTSSSSYRVMHLISNPMSMALREADAKQRQMLETLKSEAKSLRDQLATELRKVASLSIALEAMKSQLKSNENAKPLQSTHIDVVTSAAVSAMTAPSSATITPVEDVDIKKMKDRLLSAFKKRIDEYKDVVKTITGWQIDLNKDEDKKTPTRITLSSIYAESEHDTLVIHETVTEQGKNAVLELVSTPYAAKIQPEILNVLHFTKSYPSFLATIINDSIQKSTVSLQGM